MKKAFIFLIIVIFVTSSCASKKSTQNDPPDFGLRLFSYSMFPDKKFLILKEHNEIAIANSILSSYNKDDLINALSLGYLQLPPSEQAYVINAFNNTSSLPYNFQQAIVIAVTTGPEINQDPTLNSLKDLLIATYGNMTQEEVQSRYYYGLTPVEKQVFQQRWNNFSTWANQMKEQYRQEQEAAENSSGGFWKVLGVIVLGVIAGAAAYSATTYNSRVNSQISYIQQQNIQTQMQLNNIQSDLRRLAQ